MAKDWNAKQELSREIKPQTPRSKDRDWGTVIEDPFALLDAIDALKGRSDEFSRARRLAHQLAILGTFLAIFGLIATFL